MITARIDGKDVPLRFTVAAMDEIERNTGKPVGELKFAMGDAEQRAQLLAVLAALVNAAGGHADAEDLRARMTPGELIRAVYAVSDAVSEGMRMETDRPDPDAEEDVVLTELKKNAPPAGSRGGPSSTTD